jgi:hypothetical protein
MIDLAAARANAMSWLHTPLGVVSRNGAIAEELLAYDVLDALDEISRLRTRLAEACAIGRSVISTHQDSRDLDIVNERLAAIRAQVEEGK